MIFDASSVIAFNSTDKPHCYSSRITSHFNLIVMNSSQPTVNVLITQLTFQDLQYNSLDVMQYCNFCNTYHILTSVCGLLCLHVIGKTVYSSTHVSKS